MTCTWSTLSILPSEPRSRPAPQAHYQSPQVDHFPSGEWITFRAARPPLGPEEVLLDTDTPVTPLQALSLLNSSFSLRMADHFANRLKVGAQLLLRGSRHEILQERDLIREQFWAAFDAFVPSAVTSKLGEPVVA